MTKQIRRVTIAIAFAVATGLSIAHGQEQRVRTPAAGSGGSTINPAAPGTVTTPQVAPDALPTWQNLQAKLAELNDKLNQEILAKNAAIKAANDRINQLETQLNAFQQIYAKHTHEYGRVGLNWTSPQDAAQRDNILLPYRPAAKALPLDVETTGAPKSPY